MNHYVYELFHKGAMTKSHLGVRSCECLPEDDVHVSSSKYIRAAMDSQGEDKYTKTILSVWPSRSDALKEEIRLRRLYKTAVFDKTRECVVGAELPRGIDINDINDIIDIVFIDKL